jgi:integrase
MEATDMNLFCVNEIHIGMAGVSEGLGKQAELLTEPQIRAAFAATEPRRYPARDRVMVLLSVRAGLRAKEIAYLTWDMVTDAEGNVGDTLHLPNVASKGKGEGREMPRDTLEQGAA